jgi:replicative DNA helicase
MNDKALPHSPVHEQALLCCCLCEPMECVGRVLNTFGDDNPFYIPANARIYEALMAIDAHKLDLITVMSYLDNSGTLDQAGGAIYLRTVFNAVPSIAQFDTYCKWVAKLHQHRKLLADVVTLQRDLYNPKVRLDDLVDQADIAFKRTLSAAGSDTIVTMDSAVDEAVRCLDEVETLVQTGYMRLDELLSTPEGSLMILAARPGCGKTCLASGIAINLAYRKTPVGFFSLEMPKKQLMRRWASSIAEVNSKYLSDDHNRKRVLGAYDILRQLPIYVDDKPSLTLGEFIRKMRRLKAEYGVRFVVLDYLQRMNLEPLRGEQRERTVARAATEIKNALLELNMVGLILCQLNRDAANTMPDISHLRESGALEQEADSVTLLHSERVTMDELYKINSGEKPQDVSCIVGKNRHGPTGIVTLPFYKPYSQFSTTIVPDEEVPR